MKSTHIVHDNFVKSSLAGKPVAEFRHMVEEYFRIGLERRPGDLRRRPLVAFRFDWEFLFTLRPGWRPANSTRAGVVYPDQIIIEGRHPANRGKVLGLKVTEGIIRWTWWNGPNGDAAMLTFADLIEHFVSYPQDVFRQSSTKCCCCGKPLTDHLSKARGIGPDCLEIVQPWLDRRNAKAESVAQQREEYLAETGFAK